MDEKNSAEKSKKFNTFFSKIKGNLALVLVFVLVFSYVGVEINQVLNVKLETQTAVKSTVYDVVEAKAIVVRNEQVIENKNGAITMPCVANGEKVKVGGNVAMQFSSNESAHTYADYLALEKELEYYIEMEKSAVGQATDVQSLDKDILQNVNGYIRANALSNNEDAKNYADSLNDKFTKRQMLIGEKIDFSSIISSIESEIKALNTSSVKPLGYVSSAASGIFMQYTDGLETEFDYSNVKNLDVQMVENYIAAASNSVQKNNVGKIIKDFDWYFCTVVSADKMIGYKNGNSIDVSLKNSDKIIKCTIISGAENVPGQKENALVLKCSEMNDELAALRLEDIEIRIGKHEGIKLPLEAMHINNGEKGVYALVASVVEWRKADIIYTGDDYVIVSDDSETKNGIKLYDEIIIRGKDLHDGKVYT